MNYTHETHYYPPTMDEARREAALDWALKLVEADSGAAIGSEVGPTDPDTLLEIARKFEAFLKGEEQPQ